MSSQSPVPSSHDPEPFIHGISLAARLIINQSNPVLPSHEGADRQPTMGDFAASPSHSPPLGAIHISEDLTPLPELKPAGNTDITFDGQLSRPLRLREDLRTGCGGQTWPAGMVLGKHMLRYHRHELQDARM